jgi:hypothetical protein
MQNHRPSGGSDALESFMDWLAAWPPNRKPLLRRALQVLEQSWSLPDLSARVGLTENEHGDQALTSDNSDQKDCVNEFTICKCCDRAYGSGDVTLSIGKRPFSSRELGVLFSVLVKS